METKTNGSAATLALAEALGRVVEESVTRAIKPLEVRLTNVEGRLTNVGRRLTTIEAEVHEIYELVQVPEANARKEALATAPD